MKISVHGDTKSQHWCVSADDEFVGCTNGVEMEFTAMDSCWDRKQSKMTFEKQIAILQHLNQMFVIGKLVTKENEACLDRHTE